MQLQLHQKLHCRRMHIRNMYLTVIIKILIYNFALAGNVPSIGILNTSKINVDINDYFLVVNNVNDGDNTNQSLTVNVTSSNNNLLSITGVTWNQNGKYALINVKEFGSSGMVTITVTATDLDGSTKKTFDINVGKNYKRGVMFSVFDAVFWAKTNVLDALSVKDTVLSTFYNIDDPAWYCNLDLSAGPNLNPLADYNTCDNNNCNFKCFQKDDGMTLGFKGFITPTVSGTYTFYLTGQDFMEFRLSNFSDVRSITGDFNSLNQASSVVVSTSSGSNTVTYTTTLSGNNVYAFNLAAYVVFQKNYKVEWQGPGFSRRIMTSTDILTYYDINKPSIPSNLLLKSKGTNFVRLEWNEANDNQKVDHYAVYLNGTLKGITKNLFYVVTGLGINSSNSAFVVAVDVSGNESLPSNIIDFTTYTVDNTAPTPPTVVNILNTYDLAATLSWSGATDIGSEVMGYNIYLNGVKFNPSLILNTITSLKVLSPTTTYNVQIESVDAASISGGNVSVKSATYTFTTTSFNALVSTPGIKKSRVTFSEEVIGRNEGVGLNIDLFLPNNPFYEGGAFYSLIRNFAPPMIRMGGFSQNRTSFISATGINASVTGGINNGLTGGKYISWGKQFDEAAKLGCVAVSFSTGIWTTTDWYQDPEGTALKFMEYVAGDATTPQGQRRKAEGFEVPFTKRLNTIIIEFGSETWGFNSSTGVDHGSPWGNPAPTYKQYGEWARRVSRALKSSPYYEEGKFVTVYSGREPNPSDSYGLHENLFNGDDGSVDWIALGGYFGGNIGYVKDIDKGASELDYFKNGIAKIATKNKGFQETQDLFLSMSSSQRTIPVYLYETNMLSDGYNGRLGQGLIMSDWLMSGLKYGSVLPNIFHLNSGQWSIIDQVTNKPLAHYRIGSLINKYTRGNVLKSAVISVDKARLPSGTAINNFDPVGVTVTYGSGGKYAVMFFSRDFENDTEIQLALPESFNVDPSSLKKFIVSGSNPGNKAITYDSSNLSFQRDLLLTVPKYSFVLITFSGNNLDQMIAPLGFSTYKSPNGFSLKDVTENNVDPVELSYIVSFSGGNVNSEIIWDIKSLNNVNFDFQEGVTTINGAFTRFLTLSIPQGFNCNDIITITGKLKANPFIESQTVYTTINFTAPQTGCLSALQSTSNDNRFIVYPNPSNGVVYFKAFKPDRLVISDVHGRIIREIEMEKAETAVKLHPGMYFIRSLNSHINKSEKLLVIE